MNKKRGEKLIASEYYWKRRCRCSEDVIQGIVNHFDEEEMAEIWDKWRKIVREEGINKIQGEKA